MCRQKKFWKDSKGFKAVISEKTAISCTDDLTVFLTCSAAAAVVVAGGPGWWGISTSHLSSDYKTSEEEDKKQVNELTGTKKWEPFLSSLCSVSNVPISMETGLKWRQEKRGGEGGGRKRVCSPLLLREQSPLFHLCMCVLIACDSCFKKSALSEGSRSKWLRMGLIGALGKKGRRSGLAWD